MPNGKIHNNIWKTGFLVSVPLSSYVFLKYDIPIGSGIGLGYLMGRWITNDWDIMGTSEDEGRAVRELPVIGIILFGISSIYSAIFRRKHRSFITHFPGISTLVRLLFIFWWLVPLYYFHVIEFENWQLNFVFGIWSGLSFADALHWGADGISEMFKIRTRKSN